MNGPDVVAVKLLEPIRKLDRYNESGRRREDWEAAFHRAMESVLRGRSYSDYLRQLELVFAEVLSGVSRAATSEGDDATPVTHQNALYKRTDSVAEVLGNLVWDWRLEIIRRVRGMRESIRKEYANDLSPAQVFDRHKKTIVKELKKRKRLRDQLATFIHDDAYIESVWDPILEINKTNKTDFWQHVPVERLGVGIKSVRGELELFYKGGKEKNELDEVRFAPVNSGGSAERYRLSFIRADELWFEQLLDSIDRALIRSAANQFSHDGETIMRILLGDIILEPQSVGSKSSRGRPREEFDTQTVLILDAYKVPREKIGKLVETIRGTYDAKIWDPLNSRKAVDARIKNHGGNQLRYLADRCIDHNSLCKRCTWGWDREGSLVRVFRCKRHQNAPEKTHFSIGKKGLMVLSERNPVDGEPFNWLGLHLVARDEKYAANALSWLMER